MKILFDHQIFTVQKYGGISRYFYELIKELKNMDNIQINVSLLISDNYYISDKQTIKHMNFVPSKDFRGKTRLILYSNKINSLYHIKKGNFNIYHPTYYDPYFLKYINDKPFVLTVFDMIHEKFKEMFSQEDKTTENKRLLVEKATKIIAISQSTKNDLIEVFNIEPSKIEVVYLGNSMILNNKSVLDIKIPKKYILFVGSRGGYKNFDRFVRASSILLNENLDLLIVCVGGGKFKAEELSLFNQLNMKDKIFQYNLDDESLAQFYKNATMFIFPSLYEGFGIPILEAFACKCPLVCSNTSSLPEIADNGAEYFDPYNEESIYKAIKNVLDNSEYRKQLINNGIERLKHFSWEKTALQTKRVYEDILK